MEKAKLCENKFSTGHCGINIGEEGIRKRNEVNEDSIDAVNMYFSLE